MKTIELGSAPGSLEELLALARAQSGLTLMQGGQPVAQLLPMREAPRRRISPLQPGAWSVRDDFDAPLTEEFLLTPP